jgi:histone chaperone ASF1
MILCGSYINQEFIRVGYYIHNWIPSEEAEGLTVDELVKKAQRTIISEKPRITKF